MNINIFNMSKHKKFWLVQMLPFRYEDRDNYTFVNNYQEICCKKGKEGIFGIGWSDFDELQDIFGDISTVDGSLTDNQKNILREKFTKYDIEFKESNNVSDFYEKAYITFWNKSKEKNAKNQEGSQNIDKDNQGEKDSQDADNEKENAQYIDSVNQEDSQDDDKENVNKGLRKALKNFFEIKNGDVVLARLRNGEYIVGEVINDLKEYRKTDSERKVLENHQSQGFGWHCKVQEFYKISRENVPSDIIGRCSQRNSCTISSINNDRLKLFILKLLNKENHCPPIILNSNNFASALNADELEDLVYLYIQEKWDNNLILLPSQCKVNEPRYEFFLKHKNENEKIITCQVKNKAIVDFGTYKCDKNKYEKIYLFSGWGNYGDDSQKEEYKGKIEEIDKADLWNVLKENIQYFKMIQEGYYYKIEEKDEEDIEVEIPSVIGEKNKWSMIKTNEKWKTKSSKFKVVYYNDDGKITKVDEEHNKIKRSRISKIYFNYGEKENKGKFFYYHEFRTFIIVDAKDEKEVNEIKDFIKEEIAPIVEKMLKMNKI